MWKLSRIPRALEKLTKLGKKVEITFEILIKEGGQTIKKLTHVTLGNAQLKKAGQLGIIYEENGKTLKAFPHLLQKYGDDAVGIETAMTKLGSKGVSVNNMERIANNGGDIKKTLNAVDDEAKNIKWVTLDGRNHYAGRHIDGSLDKDKFTTFFPTGKTIARDSSKTLPNSMTTEQVDDLLFDGLKNSKPERVRDYLEYTYNPGKYGIDEIKIRTTLSGEVFTYFPTKGENVFAWNPDLKQWVNMK